MDQFTRRAAMATMATSLAIPCVSVADMRRTSGPIKLGLIADLHGGLAIDADARLDAFLKAMSPQKCDALVQLGDFAFPNAKHQAYADRFNAAHENTVHVIGNHEFDFGLKRADCYRSWGIDAAYYRRDIGGLRLLVLDGNEKGSPTHRGGYPSYVGEQQQRWLEKELNLSELPVLILSHQPLAGVSAIDNAAEIQQLLARHSRKIVACLNGHSHIDALEQVGGVPFLHVNSASYYWVGGRTRMAYYTDPLFTTVTVDPTAATINLTTVSSTWKGSSPKELGYFEAENRPREPMVTPQIRPHHVSPHELRVMTWNIWGKLNQDPRYRVDNKAARQRTIEIIRRSRADVVAMIETYGSARDIADALGFHHHTPSANANLCLLSRYPLSDVELLDGLNPFSFLAATVTLPRGQKVRVYDIWLTSGGRHIVKIKDPGISDDEFARGDDNRFDHLRQLLNHAVFRKDVEAADEVPVVVAGDFNCVSHLDHTRETRNAGLNHSRVLKNRVSQAMQAANFADTYRTAHPQVRADTLGHTWTTVGTDYVYESGSGFVKTDNHPRPEFQDPYARIDYIYAKGKRLRVVDSSVITRHHDYPERQFPEFPSDHAALVTTFEVR